jgi:CRISPR/Cas system CSM-associated protein Csm5 (group 7 of RAMP superfamily)
MFWAILIFILIVIFVAASEKKVKRKKLDTWRQENTKAYEEFLKDEPTMTEDEKQKAMLLLLLGGGLTQPYSGRKFNFTPLKIDQ